MAQIADTAATARCTRAASVIPQIRADTQENVMGAPIDLHVFEDHESEARGYCRRFDTLFIRAQGSVLVDAGGRRYIDFLASAGALNYGHNDPDMIEALIAHMRNLGLSAGLDLHTEAKRRFLQSFVSNILTPRGMDHRVQFTGPTGANAVEAALKLARKVTGRQNVIAFTNGYHGVSMGALAATGNRYNRMGASLPNVTRAAYDGYHGPQVDTAELLERMLADPSSGIDAPAAFILEVVQGEGGLNMASAAWLRKIAALARQHGALLIVDDIQAGCGRTGKFFSFEGMGVKPDIIALSKSISGFGLPMSLLLVTPEADQWKPAEHNGTFRGNNHAFVTATTAIEKFWVDAPAFESDIAQRAERVRSVLSELAQRIPEARVKGRGLFQGLDVRDGALADRILRLCFVNGLVIEAAGPNDEVIKVMAPITTPLPLLDQGLDILRHAVREVMNAEPVRADSWPARLVAVPAVAESWSQELI
jgi:diaminobutyrate-2-oxoglutarate transaminase